MKAIAICKCATCGQEFEVTAIKPSRRDADSWEKWAVDHYDECYSCYEARKNKDIYEREGGMLPVSVIDKPEASRMASTIRHNRARGSHSIELMTNIVAELTRAGMSDAWIMKNIGMDAEELLRLKQLSGLQELFKENDFGRAWI